MDQISLSCLNVSNAGGLSLLFPVRRAGLFPAPALIGSIASWNWRWETLSAKIPRLFLRGTDGRRSAMGGAQEDDPVLFHEYFDGDTGRGLGASHQTGWTALIALLLDHAAPTESAP